MTTPLLETRGLTKHFKVGGNLSRKVLHAVDDANLVINAQEIVALVGESGSGKSTLARLLARVYEPTSGEILYLGTPLRSMRTRRQGLAYRSDVPMVFQDPFSSLNPAFRVSHGILRGLKLHRRELDRKQRRTEAERVVEAVGLSPASDVLDRYPYELSGGQRQRIGFAQALAYRPKVILADEPVSMLDVSIRVGLLNLMTELRAEQGVSFLYITHDLASARYVSDRLLVMYAGRIVESGPTERVLADPRHPYTQLLLSAAPDPRTPVAVDSDADVGEPPRVIDPGAGCRFRRRCPLAIERCAVEDPALRELASAHSAACHVAAPAEADPMTAAR
jgi:peptide/nickel transport system ATP-binding protein